MSQLIYSLCALTAAGVTWLSLRSYLQSGPRLLFWTGICFGMLTVNNILLIFDKLVFIDNDLSIWRQAFALISVSVLLGGLIWEEE